MIDLLEKAARRKRDDKMRKDGLARYVESWIVIGSKWHRMSDRIIQNNVAAFQMKPMDWHQKKPTELGFEVSFDGHTSSRLSQAYTKIWFGEYCVLGRSKIVEMKIPAKYWYCSVQDYFELRIGDRVVGRVDCRNVAINWLYLKSRKLLTTVTPDGS